MEPAPLNVAVFAEVAGMQARLMTDIVAMIRDIGLIRSRLFLRKVKKVEKRMAAAREELINQELLFEEPRKYLKSYQDIGGKAKSPQESTREEYLSLQHLHGGQLADRRIRIFSLFEHLQSELTYKRAAIQFNRTMLISLLAVGVAVTSLVLSNWN